MKIDWRRHLVTTNDGKPLATFNLIHNLASSNLDSPHTEDARKLKKFIEEEEKKIKDGF